VISKFALRGLTEALRTELADLADVHVCTLLPYAMDTPHFESGANKVGRRAHPMPPTQSPEKVARVLVAMAEHPVRERHVPAVAMLGFGLHYLLPRTTERLILHMLRTWHFDEGREGPNEGNLYAPDVITSAPGTPRGGRAKRDA
jgi:short-subunit dehydrogenase